MIKKKGESSVTDDKQKKMSSSEREQLLIENFVGLQHAMTNLSIKFNALSENIGRLLDVFEEAAKGFIEGNSKMGDEDMLKKIDSLLEQNKTIARGLVMMEEKLRPRMDMEMKPRMEVEISNEPPRAKPKPLPNA